MREMEMMVLLIDSDGVVHSVDYPRTIHEANRINFLKGARWTETTSARMRSGRLFIQMSRS